MKKITLFLSAIVLLSVSSCYSGRRGAPPRQHRSHEFKGYDHHHTTWH